MIDTILNIDKQLFLFLNGLHNPLFDEVMWLISGQLIWLPWFAFLIFLIFRKFKLRGFIALIFIALVITACDQLSVHLFKNVFERLRPCHEPTLTGLVHIVKNKCGGKFGFVSSHAANSFGVAVFLAYILRNKWLSIILIFWASLVSYSRVYLGVHYPGDIIGGAILGFVTGVVLYKVYYLILNRLQRKYIVDSKNSPC